MKIRKDSWHYKLYEKSYSEHRFPASNTNLCKYFWRVIGGTIYLAFCIAVICAVLIGLGFLFYEHTLISVSVVAVGVAIVGLCVLYTYISDRADLRHALGYQEPEPGLLRSYVRAKKAKVCPLINFVEEENA
jgi:hypothetical protein